jgi:hypothetical protein
MQEGPADFVPPPEDPEEMVALLQRQIARLRRWFEWERWLLEPRSFAPPDDSLEQDPPEEYGPGDEPLSRN